MLGFKNNKFENFATNRILNFEYLKQKKISKLFYHEFKSDKKRVINLNLKVIKILKTDKDTELRVKLDY